VNGPCFLLLLLLCNTLTHFVIRYAVLPPVVHVDSQRVILPFWQHLDIFERRSNTCGHVFPECGHDFRRDSGKDFPTRVSIWCIFTVKIRGTPIELRIQFDRKQVLPIRMSTQVRYNRGAQMTQHPSRFLDKKDRVCAIAARHRPSAWPTRRRLATGIVPSSTHHTRGRIPRTHTQLRTSRPPSRARISGRRGRLWVFWGLARVPVHK